MRIAKRRPYLSKEAGEFRFDFYYDERKLNKSHLRISTTSGLWGMRIAGNCDAYGYLLAAAKQERDDQLQGYAVTLFIASMELTQEQVLCDDVQQAVVKWLKRKEQAGGAAAEAVTETQEEAAQVFMEDVAAYAEASPKEREKIREADREAMRDAISASVANE